jgi:hypothetical protein
MRQVLSLIVATHGLGSVALAGGRDFYDCGQLVAVAGCPTLIQDSQGLLHQLDDLNGYQVGDQVEVTGKLVTCSVPCGGTGTCVVGAFVVPCSAGPTGTSFYFGDGTSGLGRPCANQSALGAGEGCVNSTGIGARLTATGSPLFVDDDLGFLLNGGRPNQPRLLVQGEGQQVLPFKDGIFCLSNPTERVEVVILDGSGSGSTSSSMVTNGAIPGPGATRYYQQWYRDPQLSPCGSGSNFSNAVQVDWI